MSFEWSYREIDEWLLLAGSGLHLSSTLYSQLRIANELSAPGTTAIVRRSSSVTAKMRSSFDVAWSTLLGDSFYLRKDEFHSLSHRNLR